MSNQRLGLRLLELQKEYQERAELASLSAEFRQGGWIPRSAVEIAEEYEATLRELLAD